MINYLSRFNLKGKIAVVAGGTGLIGREISIAFSQAGAYTIIADINDSIGKQLELELKQKGFQAEYFNLDISKTNKIKDNIKLLFKKYNKIDIWVNVAYPRTKDFGNNIHKVSLKSWQKNVDIHMNSYCLITRDIAELMKKKKIKGNIINFGSIYGVSGPDFNIYPKNMTSPAVYSAIKGGIINFTRYVASYYGKFGIRANCICPGGILNNQNKRFISNYEKRVPLKKMGKPEEIASATLFLASDAASYITGTTFMVDGGWTCI